MNEQQMENDNLTAGETVTNGCYALSSQETGRHIFCFVIPWIYRHCALQCLVWNS